MTDTGLDQLEVAYRRVLNDIRELDDPQARVDEATRVSEALFRMRSEISDLRIRAIGMIWETDALSLAQLSERVGVSRGRAAQMTRDYQKRKDVPSTRALPWEGAHDDGTHGSDR